MEFLQLKRAEKAELDAIWQIICGAIQKRAQEGSSQWQNGYPNEDVLKHDIEMGYGWVCKDRKENQIIGFVALIFDGESAYENIDGSWLTDDNNFAVVHRLATKFPTRIKGIGTWMLQNLEEIVLQNDVKSIRVDTNFDNGAMLHVFQKLNYTYCGEVILKGGKRKAFEKIINLKKN